MSNQALQALKNEPRTPPAVRIAELFAIVNGLGWVLYKVTVFPSSEDVWYSITCYLLLIWIAITPAIWACRTYGNESRLRYTTMAQTTHISPIGRCCGLVLIMLFVASLSILVCWRTSVSPFAPNSLLTFASSPPLIHDEYSYLFQSDTFLGGQMSYASHPQFPSLFDSMHVLNEGKYASRYFPGAGCWIAPFRWLGAPELGHWVAAALICILVFLIGDEISGPGTGAIAATLTACSPGMAIFSNLILSHHPALLGLLLAFWGAVRLSKNWNCLNALLTGTGLGYGLLCRPLTAIGWGGVLIMWLGIIAWNSCKRVHSIKSLFSQDFIRSAVLLGPITGAIVLQAVFNDQITNDWLTTPYTQYQEIYTPRHCYGFDNVRRGENVEGEKILNDYDRWAENLTIPLAWNHLEERLYESVRFSLGDVPIIIAFWAFVVIALCVERQLLVLPCLIGVIHLVYFPYWFTGILGWHYVFETLPVWCLMTAWVTTSLLRHWRRESRHILIAWWALLIVASMALNFWGPAENSALKSGLRRFVFQAERYRRFHSLVKQSVTRQPAIVFVEAGEGDLHLEYIVNHPALDSAIIYARTRGAMPPLARIRESWPNRWLYAINMNDNSAVLLSEPLFSSTLK